MGNSSDKIVLLKSQLSSKKILQERKFYTIYEDQEGQNPKQYEYWLQKSKTTDFSSQEQFLVDLKVPIRNVSIGQIKEYFPTVHLFAAIIDHPKYTLVDYLNKKEGYLKQNQIYLMTSQLLGAQILLDKNSQFLGLNNIFTNDENGLQWYLKPLRVENIQVQPIQHLWKSDQENVVLGIPPPEYKAGEFDIESTKIFSLGMVLLKLILNESLSDMYDDKQELLINIFQQKIQKLKQLENIYEREFIELILTMLSIQPGERKTFKDLTQKFLSSFSQLPRDEQDRLKTYLNIREINQSVYVTYAGQTSVPLQEQQIFSQINEQQYIYNGELDKTGKGKLLNNQNQIIHEGDSTNGLNAKNFQLKSITGRIELYQCYSFALNNDKTILFVGQDIGKIQLYRFFAPLKLITTLDQQDYPIYQLFYVKKKNSIIWANENDIVEGKYKNCQWKLTKIQTGTILVGVMELNLNGDLLITGYLDGTVKFLELREEENWILTHKLKLSNGVSFLSLNTTGQKLISGNFNNQLSIILYINSDWVEAYEINVENSIINLIFISEVQFIVQLSDRKLKYYTFIESTNLLQMYFEYNIQRGLNIQTKGSSQYITNKNILILADDQRISFFVRSQADNFMISQIIQFKNYSIHFRALNNGNVIILNFFTGKGQKEIQIKQIIQ